MESPYSTAIQKTLEWAALEGHQEVLSALSAHLNRQPDQYGHKEKVFQAKVHPHVLISFQDQPVEISSVPLSTTEVRSSTLKAIDL
jgi:2'-5' RNA ligase